jgi:hypothetical protein
MPAADKPAIKTGISTALIKNILKIVLTEKFKLFL